MADVLAILKVVCSSDPDRETVATPFLLLYEGQRWAAGTDGHCLAALPFDGEVRSDGPDAAKVIPTAPPTHRASIAALRAFAGKPKMEECDSCHGDKKWGCNCPDCIDLHPCEDCDGKGEYAAIRYARMLDGHLNPDLLLQILSTVPPAVAEVTLTHAGAEDPFAFRAPGWIGLIMPIVVKDSYVEKVAAVAPVFAEAVPL